MCNLLWNLALNHMSHQCSIHDANEVLVIIDNMSDSDRCSGEDNSASGNDITSPMSEHSMGNSESTVSYKNT